MRRVMSYIILSMRTLSLMRYIFEISQPSESSSTWRVLWILWESAPLIAMVSLSFPLFVWLFRIVFAVGGKENDLKVYRLSDHSLIWQARNVPHDFLDLRVPVHIKDFAVCWWRKWSRSVVFEMWERIQDRHSDGIQPDSCLSHPEEETARRGLLYVNYESLYNSLHFHELFV